MKQDTDNIAIKVDSLSKVYPLYRAPNDRLKEALHPLRKKYHKDFYALHDISFCVKRGDSLGVIGQNGSGKSTLLKILSRVLTPSSGKFEIGGRIVSLLELGSGFNPELTGLENIYFYGTILGFSQKQIKEKLDSIINFAEIGQFIYQPIKTYSSGMRSRLAFSVASQVNPDVLILDEVLAVGDLRFTQKCFRVMREIIDHNKTVILVTHSMGAVTSFCNKVMWLHDGKIKEFGAASEVVKKYVGFMTYGLDNQSSSTIENEAGEVDDSVSSQPNYFQEENWLSDVKWLNASGFDSFGQGGALIEKAALYYRGTSDLVEIIKNREWLSLFAYVKVNEKIESPGFGILIKDSLGNSISTANNYIHDRPMRRLEEGEVIIIKVDFKFPLLKNGKYFISIAVSDGNQAKHTQHHWVHDVFSVRVSNSDQKFGLGSCLLVFEEEDYHLDMLKLV